MQVESGFDNNSENVTIFVTLISRSVNSIARIINKWSDTTKPYPYALRHNFQIAAYSPTSPVYAIGANVKGGYDKGKINFPYVVSARRVKSVNLSIWLNGDKSDDVLDTIPSGISTINNSPLYIGCQGVGSSASSYGDFNVGEIIIYSRALSDVEISRVNQYLSQKWNIKF